MPVIGAGGVCDGRILISHDLPGSCTRVHPRFVRRFAQLGREMRSAFERYGRDVRAKKSAWAEESY
ncbi:MAG: 3-methyl-2-oxobutanoate hydroxymethyltransferase [Ramlibacter sp.]